MEQQAIGVSDFKIQELENEQVKLVPLAASDFERLYEVASDPLIWEQHPANDRYKREVFERFFHDALACHTAFIVLDKQTGQVMGSTRYYDYRQEEQSIAIGYTFLARRYWGGSYNQPIKKMLLDFAFQQVEKVYFHVGATNLRSQKAVLKTGAIKVTEAEKTTQSASNVTYIIEKKNWNV